MNFQKELNERYNHVYTILQTVHLGISSGFMDVLQNSRHDLDVKAALEYILEKKWIGNLDQMHENEDGNYSVILNKDPFVTTDGLRFINFYEKYQDKGLDVASMTVGDSQLVEYFVNSDKNSFFKLLTINVVISIVTAIVTTVVTTLLSS